MTAVRRLHPRHWDGHRLLQFLTGLALLTLAFGPPTAPAASPATAKAPTAATMPATTTVEAPVAADGLGSVQASVAAAVPVTRDGVAPAAARTVRDSAECQHDGSRAARAVPPAGDAVALAGIAQRAHGSRAPPRHS